MSAKASQTTSLSIVCSTVCSGANKKKQQSSASWALCGNSPVTGEFPAQSASNSEDVSIWCRHPALGIPEARLAHLDTLNPLIRNKTTTGDAPLVRT